MLNPTANLVIKFLAGILNVFFKYESPNYIRNYLNKFFSIWVSKNLNKCGDKFMIKRHSYFKGLKYISIGDNFSSLSELRIECWDNYENESFKPQLSIGNEVTVNYNLHIGCINKISIGNNVLFASNIFITDHYHGNISYGENNTPPKKRHLYSKGPVVIEDDVWIGENVSIMPNVTIGKGSIIGANSVVTKSFPEFSVIGGVPAILIKELR